MKYIQEVAPSEKMHQLEISDSELKYLLDLAECFARHDSTITIHGDTFRPTDAGFDKLAGIVQMLAVVPLEGYDAGRYWKLDKGFRK